MHNIFGNYNKVVSCLFPLKLYFQNVLFCILNHNNQSESNQKYSANTVLIFKYFITP